MEHYIKLGTISLKKSLLVTKISTKNSSKGESIYYIAPWVSKQPVRLPIGPMWYVDSPFFIQKKNHKKLQQTSVSVYIWKKIANLESKSH